MRLVAMSRGATKREHHGTGTQRGPWVDPKIGHPGSKFIHLIHLITYFLKLAVFIHHRLFPTHTWFFRRDAQLQGHPRGTQQSSATSCPHCVHCSCRAKLPAMLRKRHRWMPWGVMRRKKNTLDSAAHGGKAMVHGP